MSGPIAEALRDALLEEYAARLANGGGFDLHQHHLDAIIAAAQEDMPNSLTVNGHFFVHVAACPCQRIQAEVARLAEPAQDGEQ